MATTRNPYANFFAFSPVPSSTNNSIRWYLKIQKLYVFYVVYLLYELTQLCTKKGIQYYNRSYTLNLSQAHTTNIVFLPVCVWKFFLFYGITDKPIGSFGKFSKFLDSFAIIFVLYTDMYQHQLILFEASADELLILRKGNCK